MSVHKIIMTCSKGVQYVTHSVYKHRGLFNNFLLVIIMNCCLHFPSKVKSVVFL